MPADEAATLASVQAIRLPGDAAVSVRMYTYSVRRKNIAIRSSVRWMT